MISIGDKLVVTKQLGFLDEGDVVEVTNVDNNNMVSFTFGENGQGVMSYSECERHFEKIAEEESAPSITSEYIDDIMMHSEITIHTVFDKCTIVACQLPNGFVIVESSACVSPENYDKGIGINICVDKIRNKIWELEGYNLQEELYRESQTTSYSCEDCACYDCPDADECEECPCDECMGYDEEYEEDEYSDTDVDCSNCDDYNCPNNTNNK